MQISAHNILGIQVAGEAPVVSAVTSYSDLCASFRLVNQYQERCGRRWHHGGMYYTAYQLLPFYRAWLVHQSETLSATLGITHDSEVGLPMSFDFPREYEALRGLGLQLCELTSIGLAEGGERTFAWSLAALFRYSLESNVDELCVVVQPREVEFWHESLGFRILARTRTCSKFENSTALLMTFSVKAWREGRKQLTPFLKGLVQSNAPTLKLTPRPVDISWHEVARLLAQNPEAIIPLGARQLGNFQRMFLSANSVVTVKKATTEVVG